ncbi:hypothetical protein SAMN05445850_8221 [Paraburkholderia tuberum]|uniref:Uncharacterized protein n=1 Tax=Paraburkholderia tuberum TaxID=157910 RepID=A0A1H1KJF2_9BURK|nr:hypothetical protein SAMN05445850_8221 [Paraburkholderia tuberum]
MTASFGLDHLSGRIAAVIARAASPRAIESAVVDLLLATDAQDLPRETHTQLHERAIAHHQVPIDGARLAHGLVNELAHREQREPLVLHRKHPVKAPEVLGCLRSGSGGCPAMRQQLSDVVGSMDCGNRVRTSFRGLAWMRRARADARPYPGINGRNTPGLKGVRLQKNQRRAPARVAAKPAWARGPVAVAARRWRSPEIASRSRCRCHGAMRHTLTNRPAD